MSNPNFDDIVTTTLQRRSKKLADNISRNQGLLYRMRQKGTIRPFPGGRTIVEEIEYQENSTYRRYAGYDLLNINPSVTYTSAEFDIRQAAVAVSISGLEQLQNAGEDAVIELLPARIKTAEKSLANGVYADMYSDGTADFGRQIGGLQLLVADNPATGTVGGINRATTGNAYWRNQFISLSTEGLGTPASTNIQTAMNRLWILCTRQNDTPDIIMAGNTFYRLYEESLQTLQRVTTSKMADAGFEAIKYKGADVVLDGGQGGACPDQRMYFLNTDYIFFRPHAKRNFVALEQRMSYNQDAMVKLLAFAGNMTMSNASLQGVLRP
ncbi:hypothetical protein UFOVP413_20 [uncultured Caudovirales phage]|uniref:Phage major capsid protein n=1 Tax=uncultured Caudovirales phage TaxID=2100421 RepID=A0A6J5M7F8_9CAUD|nr:hypothetical protein UFOVP413_20 [uncultured Caudovirales phage]